MIEQDCGYCLTLKMIVLHPQFEFMNCLRNGIDPGHARASRERVQGPHDVFVWDHLLFSGLLDELPQGLYMGMRFIAEDLDQILIHFRKKLDLLRFRGLDGVCFWGRRWSSGFFLCFRGLWGLWHRCGGCRLFFYRFG